MFHRFRQHSTAAAWSSLAVAGRLRFVPSLRCAIRSILLMCVAAAPGRDGTLNGFCFVGRAWVLRLFSPASGEPLFVLYCMHPPCGCGGRHEK